MTLKSRISLIISISLTILFLAFSISVVYTNYEFRKFEFKKRLEEKALTTVKLLIDVKEVDRKLLRIIDENSVNKLFDEKTLVFNDSLELIYSSLDDHRIHWKIKDLTFLKKHHSFFRQSGNDEIFGIYYLSQGKTYYVLTSANDLRGKRKLNFLILVMAISSFIFLIISWLLIRYTVKKGLKPLNMFIQQISKTNENNLSTRIILNKNSKNEIDLIAKEFNLMLFRIEKAYEKQREFTAQASHELKTPIARIILQLENLMYKLNEEQQIKATNIINDAKNLNELIQSLLLLTKIENTENPIGKNEFINEILENSIDKTCKLYSDLKIEYNIEISNQDLESLSLNCDKLLMEIVFNNLLKNAYLYSSNKKVKISIFNKNNILTILFENEGTPISKEEKENIFKPFVRGKNASGKSGLGLGLRIIERILSFYGYSIKYNYDIRNEFYVFFNKT